MNDPKRRNCATEGTVEPNARLARVGAPALSKIARREGGLIHNSAEQPCRRLAE
jgi:hypothetical protein